MKFRRNRQGRKTGGKITQDLLQKRAERCMAVGYPKQKWVLFCETLLKHGYSLRLYEAVRTESKYITVEKEGATPFKVRFSAHKPLKYREIAGDCDFFVGVTHLGITTYQDALTAVYAHFMKQGVMA